MFNPKIGDIGDAVHVAKPAGASLRHALDSLRDLRFPRPEGFTAGPGSTDLSLFVLDPRDPFGPVGYSTDARRLYFYKAVFADGAMGIMTITGDSLALLLRDRALQNALYALRAEAQSRGGIESHTLCAIKTPLSKHTLVDFAQRHHSQVVLQSAIQSELSGEAGGVGELRLKLVDIDGWSPRSSSLPQCVLQRLGENSTDVLMKFVWAKAEGHSAELLF
jgi:hypothetical protein